MSTHIEFAHVCSNNFHPFNLNYVTKILYLLTLSIINTLSIFFIDPTPPYQNNFCGGWGYIFSNIKNQSLKTAFSPQLFILQEKT